MRILIILLLVCITQDSTDYLKGSWRLVSYDAITKIRTSPGYLFAEEDTRERLEKNFQEILLKGKYNFTRDTLYYTDLESGAVVYRNAHWRVEGKVLYIEEIRRPFKRQAFIHRLSKDSLVISPYIDGQVGDSKMFFLKQPDTKR